MVTIEADEEVWRYLQVRKNPGDSMNDVLRRELALSDSAPDERPERAATPPESGAVARARDALADHTWPDTNDARARAATLDAVAVLDDAGEPLRRAAIVEAVDSEYAESTLWSKAVQPGLRALVNAGVLAHRRNVGYWVENDD